MTFKRSAAIRPDSIQRQNGSESELVFPEGTNFKGVGDLAYEPRMTAWVGSGRSPAAAGEVVARGRFGGKAAIPEHP